MKQYNTDEIRNVCLAGQRGCGKTSVADAIAFDSGVNNRVGRVDDGSSLLDYTETEISKKTTVSGKLLACEWKNKKINLMDCPGHADFFGEMHASLKVSDSVGMVLDASAGVEIGTQLQWRVLEDYGLARFFLINKMDKENANWQQAIESINTSFGKSAVPIQLPIGQAASFKGVIDLLKMKAITFAADGKVTESDIPADLKDEADAARESMIEMVAEADDALLEKFFEEGTLSDEEVSKGLQIGIASGKLWPVLATASGKNEGIATVLDFIAENLPSPAKAQPMKASADGSDEVTELAFDPAGKPMAFVYKVVSEGHLGDLSFFRAVTGSIKAGLELTNFQTRNSERIGQVYTFQGKNRIELPAVVAGDIGVLVKLKDTHQGQTLAEKGAPLAIVPVKYPRPIMDVAISSKAKGDEEKIAVGLQKLLEEDPTFEIIPDAALRQQVLWGQGAAHIDLIAEKLKQRYGVEVETSKPRIPYRETIKSKTEQQYKHKKQSGGRGQFGEVYIRLEPNVRGNGFEFVDEISGGVIPGKFIPAVEKGVVEQMVNGGLCGAQVVDVRVALYFGSFHDVDSSDMAFKIAGSMAFREGYMNAKPVILEPIYNMEILVPNDFTGDVMGDLSSRRGKIAGMDPEGGSTRVRATVPQAELYQYCVDLRSMTQGQGFYTMEFSHYQEVPHETAQKVIAAAQADKEAQAG
ncbi:MAG: elongation factor G [candidate division Zixibacteria bacterium]